MIATKLFDDLDLGETRSWRDKLHRWLDPNVGRWNSEDPIGFAAGDANVYRYVGNTSTMFHDASGLNRRLQVWFGHAYIEVDDGSGGITNLHFSPSGYTVDKDSYPGAVPILEVKTSPSEDDATIVTWRELENERQEGRVKNWSLLNHCWAPVLPFFDKGGQGPDPNAPPVVITPVGPVYPYHPH